MIKEFYAENFTKIPSAIYNGANRIALCDNLAVGGTTPSTGVIEETLAYTSEKSIPVTTMIRPRGGNFVYNDIELKIMHTDLIEAKKLGTDGVMIGCLTSDDWLDEEALELLIDTSEGVQITFHHAFDSLAMKKQFDAIDWLVNHKVDRILTHGGPLETAVEENFELINKLIDYAADRITIVPTGIIDARNIDKVTDALSIDEIQSTEFIE